MSDPPPVSREGFLAFLDQFQQHLMQMREEGVRVLEAEQGLVRNVGQAVRRPSPVPTPSSGRPPAVGPVRWASAIRKEPTGSITWSICAEEASFAGDAGKLLQSILAAAGFKLAGVPSPEAPQGECAMTLAFGMRAFQAASGNPRILFDRSRGRVLAGPHGQLLGTNSPPDLLPNNVPLKKIVWGDIKTALAACGLTVR